MLIQEGVIKIKMREKKSLTDFFCIFQSMRKIEFFFVQNMHENFRI
jgi:hypothetical protein